jgi:hypothetical protein
LGVIGILLVAESMVCGDLTNGGDIKREEDRSKD